MLNVVLMLLLGHSFSLFAQEQDSTHILDYSDKLLLRVYTVTKINSLTILNKHDRNKNSMKNINIINCKKLFLQENQDVTNKI